MVDAAPHLAELGVSIPPTQADLPYSDGEPMETQRHQFQMELLINALLWPDSQSRDWGSGMRNSSSLPFLMATFERNSRSGVVTARSFVVKTASFCW